MKKALLLLVCATLCARENPFLPSVQLNNPSAFERESEFSKIAFSFPKDARKLQRMKLEYLAADGSLKDYTIEISQPVDWHKVYMLLSDDELLRRSDVDNNSQNSTAAATPPAAPIPPAPALETPPAGLQLAPSQDAPNLQLGKLQLASEDEEISEKNHREIIKVNKNLTFYVAKDELVIETPSKLLREFSLSKPDRIVLDFAGSASKKERTYPLVNSAFDALVLGVHNGFFRVVLHTDSKYDYDIHYNDQNLVIKLK